MWVAGCQTIRVASARRLMESLSPTAEHKVGVIKKMHARVPPELLHLFLAVHAYRDLVLPFFSRFWIYICLFYHFSAF